MNDDFDIFNIINIIEYELSYRDYSKKENEHTRNDIDYEYTKKDKVLKVTFDKNYGTTFEFYESDYIVDSIDLDTEASLDEVIDVLNFIKRYGK